MRTAANLRIILSDTVIRLFFHFNRLFKSVPFSPNFFLKGARKEKRTSIYP